ncbi:Protein 5NUC [Anthophora quadrimaculata]
MLPAVSLATLSTAIMAFSSVVLGNPMSIEPEGLTVRILHNNDMHSRFEQTSKLSTVCAKKEAEAGECYGGFARIATLIRQARKSSIPCLFLNAGDTYQGSTWFTVYKWKVVSKFLNLLAPNVTSLGNHEFDDGVDGLVPFIQNAMFPIVTSNLDLSKEPKLAATKLQNSTVLTVNGVKIGVIGYLTPETKILSKSENVIFLDEVESIRREAKILKKQGVNILIALGHSGFKVDKKIAKEVEDIDIVIGGHTNTFLYNGEQPNVEVPEGLYPTIVRQKSGRKTYVVQAYAYTKYLGNLTVTFDKDGEVTRIAGNPILVNSSIEQAEDILMELKEMREAIDNISSVVVGSTRVLLEGDSKVCRRRECNLGNLITDAMIDHNVREYAEWSVYNLEGNTANLAGAFLQYSGLQVVYDLTQPKNSRVVSVQVLCALCSVPTYSELRMNETYTVLLSDFMQSGGDGYSMLKDLKASPIGSTADEVLVEYLKRHSPVHPAVEWRIIFADNQKEHNGCNTVHPSVKLTILLTIISWLFVR